MQCGSMLGSTMQSDAEQQLNEWFCKQDCSSNIWIEQFIILAHGNKDDLCMLPFFKSISSSQ